MTIAKRIDVPVHGLGLPGHFVVRYQPADGESELIDVFDRGKRLTMDDARRLILQTSGQTLESRHWEPALHRDILKRMLMNLLGVAQRQEDPKSMVRYLEGLVAVDDQDVAIRGMRAVIRHQQGRKQAALDDLDWILEHRPAGIDLERVAAMRDAFSGR